METAHSNHTPVGASSRATVRRIQQSGAQRSTSRRSYGLQRKMPGSRPIGETRRAFPRTPVENDQEPPCLAGLISSTWHTYKVTPLFNFKSQTRHLKNYGRLLSAFIQAERKKGDAVDVAGESADKVELSFYPGLKISQDDPMALQVLMRAHNPYGNGELRTVLTAYLLGVEMEGLLEPHLQQAFTHYPVMLVRGPITLTRLLLDWLKSQFDCSASQLLFASLDLTWMLAMWSGQLISRASKPVNLEYSLPPGCDGLEKITMTINAEDCREIWNCVHDKEYQDVTADEVAVFVSCLENHFYQHFKIKLGAMQLSRVGTALAYVGAEGKVKIFSEDYALLILRHLTCLAMEKLGTYSQ